MRILLIGVGGFGRSWRHALTTVPGVEIAGMVDIRREALDDAAAFFGVPPDRLYPSDDLPWEEADADAVIHSAPQNVRHAHIMRALRAGKHVLTVKPLSDGYETAVEMAAEAAHRGRTLVVAQQMRHHPLILRLREAVRSGEIGDVADAHVDFFFGRAGYAGSYEQPYPLLVQGSIHHFDFMRWILGADAQRVWAENWNPAWVTGHGKRAAYAVFEMTNGVRVCYRSIPTRGAAHSWLCDWRIEGTTGIAEAIGDRVVVNGEMVLDCREDMESFNNRRLPELQAVLLREFLDAASGGAEPGTSGRNNLNSLAMSFGAIRSGETGMRQDLNTYPRP